MFKTKKTQFAIRKLAKGAVAVLLSFGILAGPSAPIVSAASEAIQNEMTDDTTSNEVISDTTSVVEESVPVENNTADTLTTDNTEVSANYSENTDDSTTTTVQTDTDVSTQEKTDPETSVNTEQPIQTEEAESTTPVEDINSKSEENVSQNNNINTSKEGTNKKDKPNINEMTKEELANHIKDLADKHPLGIAGIFHIFGNEVTQNGHIAGNIAADKLSGTNFGTNSNATNNLTNGDIHYVGNLNGLNKIDGDNKVVIFGPDIEYRSFENDGAIEVNYGTAEKPDWRKVDIPYNHIVQADQKIDIQGELDKLSQKSDNWASQAQIEGVKADFNDLNNSWIDVSEAIKNAGDSKEPIYVTIDAAHLSGDKRNITIKGIPAGAEAPMIILNVTNIQGGDLTVQTHLVLEYADGNNIGGSSETPNQFNKLLWNFGTDVNKLHFAGDYHLGSVLATNAHITNAVNIDGNIIGNKVTVSGETHRWDLTPPFVEIEEPEKPDPKPEPEPENPTPDTPAPQPKPEETPDNTEDFTPPLNEDVLDLDGTDENETPAGEESTEEAIAPLPKNVIEKNQKEVTSTAVTEKSSETTTKPKAEVENENVTETSKEVGLPETGEDKTNLITTGIVLASIAATITALGSFINKKN
ncbi:cell surface protein [Lactobacillus amylovorus]|uniref:Cell surface protein n=1 Tax=Lactobacillus amylovorus TaxID=1604 RepID=A0AAW6BC94_LACAM|nr:cell surface protein [Lactobacillus amylovorus]MDA6090040.1 cell surface protein [Lactobacillus amylovorus]MDB6239034.1 cell surface protein [Lactobacillus amylovorus]MDB6247347.1 cell surface protein [Lactobacillus amylovorus]UIK34831.1 cell surface protein [Lactobacillus amylovorus]